jgi:hypothetical protein
MRAARSQIEGTSVSVRKKGLGKKERPWVWRHRKDKQSALQTFYSFIHHEELICSTVYQNNFNSTGKAAQGAKVKKNFTSEVVQMGHKILSCVKLHLICIAMLVTNGAICYKMHHKI